MIDNLFLPMFTHDLFTHVLPTLPMLTSIYSCLAMFTRA